MTTSIAIEPAADAVILNPTIDVEADAGSITIYLNQLNRDGSSQLAYLTRQQAIALANALLAAAG